VWELGGCLVIIRESWFLDSDSVARAWARIFPRESALLKKVVKKLGRSLELGFLAVKRSADKAGVIFESHFKVEGSVDPRWRARLEIACWGKI